MSYAGKIPMTRVDTVEGAAAVFGAYKVRLSRIVPRGLFVRSENTLHVNPETWHEVFPPPGWSRYTAGEREVQRDRRRRARRPPIAYSTP